MDPSDASSVSTKLYAYNSLDELRTIRIFKLRKDLSCSLDVVKLDDRERPSYTALSYTWGDCLGLTHTPSPGESTKLIQCDDCVLSVTPNLFDALTRLSLTHSGQYLWIDAICINQQNEVEKSMQVSMMGDIYANAAAVHVWLGQHDEHSSTALPLIQAFGEKLRQLPSFTLRRLNDKDSFEEMGMEASFTTEQWRSILTFFGRSWFHRTWVIQEVALGRNVTVSCGDWTGLWEVILNFALYMQVQGWTSELRRLPELSGPVALALGINFLVHMAQLSRLQERGLCGTPFANNIAFRVFGTSTQEGRVSAYFAWLVHRNRNFDVTNPRDKIYAPLAMVSRLAGMDALRAVWPDYKKSVEDVFTGFTAWVMKSCCSLSIMCLVGDAVDRERRSLPSWVPDFDDVGASRITSHCYESTIGWRSRTPNAVISFPKQHELQVQAIRFDVVVECSQNVSLLLEGAADASIFQVINKLDMADRRTGEHPWEVCMQTLAGDCFNTDGVSFGVWSDVLKLEDRWTYITKSYRQWVLSKVMTALVLSQGLKVAPYHELAETWYAQYEVVTKGTSADTGDNTGREYWEELLQCFMPESSETERASNLRSKTEKNAGLFQTLMRRHSTGMLDGPLARTRERNTLCLVLRSGQAGDEVWFLRGSKMPLVLRPKGGNGRYSFVGEAYVHNFMQGEYFLQDLGAMDEDRFTKSETIIIE